MKSVYNSKTWNLIVSVIERVIDQNIEIKGNEDEEEIKDKCSKLALYSKSADIKIKQSELMLMEREGKLFCINIFIGIKRHYYILSKIYDQDYSKHIQLCKNLNDYLGGQFYYQTNEETIEQLLILGMMLPPLSADIPDVRLDQMIESATFLKGYGIEPDLEQSGFLCSEETSQKLFDMIEKKISTVGGNLILEKLWDSLSNKYFSILDLYNISRNTDDDRNEPINLLLNLALKHLHTNVNPEHRKSMETAVDEIFQISRAWLDVSDIQSQYAIEYSMMGLEDFPLYFSNEILFDKFCLPKQYNKKYILLLLEYLIKPFFEKANTKYTFKDYYSVAEYIMNVQYPYIFLNPHEIHAQTQVANYKIKLILQDLSKPIKEINQNFTSLSGMTNLYISPLIRFPLEKILYLDYHFTGLGFYHIAYSMIKSNYAELDKMQGHLLEKMLRDEIEKKGYSMFYGNYHTTDDNSDCDIVMSDADRVCFFEVKKRDIADEFNKLDDVAALQQLSQGMIKAQKQAFRHKKNLIKNKKLLFDHEGKKSELLYNGTQNVYLFSVCLPEYSFITSKSFSSKLLEIIFLGGFSTIDVNRQKDVDKLNKFGKIILQYANEIYGGAPLNAHSLSFYSSFTSAQQFLLALWCSNDQAEFLEMVRNWIYGTDNTLNPYYSILVDVATRDHTYNIRKTAIDKLEKIKKEAVFVSGI